MEFLLEQNGREGVRHGTIGIMSNISDGTAAFVGVVEDVSRNGLRISQVPAEFDEAAVFCRGIINGPREEYVFALKPRWVSRTHRGMYKMIGFEIEAPTEKWTSFVDGMKDDMGPLGFLLPSRAAA
jgi:hypothetical protein